MAGAPLSADIRGGFPVTRPTLEEIRFAEAIEARHLGAYRAAVEDLLVATAAQPDARPWALERLERVIADVLGLGEVLGARSILRDVAGAMVDDGTAMRAELGSLIAFRDTEPPVQVATLSDAVRDMIARTPVTLRPAAERVGARIAQVYSQQHAIAFTRSADQAVTERVQALIAQALQEGTPEREAVQGIRLEVDRIRKETQPWTDAYTQTAFRTNVNSAVTAGRFRQANDPAVAAMAPCLQFQSALTSTTRHNHAAADGIVMLSTNPQWNRIAPPLGFNCLCSVNIVTVPMLRRMGRLTPSGAIIEDTVPPGAFPDPGFRHEGRPDIAAARSA
jgi:hypothetical protein